MASIAALAKRIDALAKAAVPPLRAEAITILAGEAMPVDTPGKLLIVRVLHSPKEHSHE